nr:hypothetical protein [Tanacetum cinerariifolium]
MARQLEEEMERNAQRMNEQIAKDAKIARIHAEEELQIMIDGLDMNNETIAKYLQEYYQFTTELPIGEMIELIDNLVKYQDNYAKVLKYQTQQRKPLSKKQQREFYMSIQDFFPMGSKEEGERFNRKGISLEQDNAKKAKTSEEVSEEDLKAMMQLVPVEEVYVEALQKHTQAMMHDPVEWRLYDSYCVHHVLSKDQEIFMLVEKEYPLRKGLVIAMIINKLQMENYSQMANDLIQKIYKIANSPSQRSD